MWKCKVCDNLNYRKEALECVFCSEDYTKVPDDREMVE